MTGSKFLFVFAYLFADGGSYIVPGDQAYSTMAECQQMVRAAELNKGQKIGTRTVKTVLAECREIDEVTALRLARSLMQP